MDGRRKRRRMGKGRNRGIDSGVCAGGCTICGEDVVQGQLDGEGIVYGWIYCCTNCIAKIHM
jgi:hypothetical protein